METGKKKDCTHTLDPPSHTVHTFNENWQTKEPLIYKEKEGRRIDVRNATASCAFEVPRWIEGEYH